MVAERRNPACFEQDVPFTFKMMWMESIRRNK